MHKITSEDEKVIREFDKKFDNEEFPLPVGLSEPIKSFILAALAKTGREVAEKLIEDIPQTTDLYTYDKDGLDGSRECDTEYLKHQLRAKWLGEKNE